MKRSYLAASMALLFVQTISAETFTADVWADNWFSLNVDGQLVAKDSVSITTERSFNAESFSFEAQKPFVLGLIAKDFKENDSGLEYIGSRRQQTSFDATDWSPATEHSERSVSPKGDYDRISWDSNAKLIWGPDLETDNTVLCRLVVQ